MNGPIKLIVAGVAILSSLSSIANSAEIRVLAALGIKEVIDDLKPQYERTTNHRLLVTFDTMGGAVKRIQTGDNADIIIIPQQGIDSLIKSGKAAAGGTTVIARSGIAVAIRKGAPKPDISTADAFRRTLLSAKSITYSDPALGGASAIHFVKVLDRLGISNEMKPKTILSKAGTETAELVANGKAELGVNQLQVLIAVTGIDIAGPIPGDLQATTVFSAVATSNAKNIDGIKALIAYLRTPEAAALIKSKGMEPG